MHSAMDCTMDPTPQQISAMADELLALAKSLETSSDRDSIRHTKAAVVMKAKHLIGQVQDPMDAVMDHVTNVFVVSAARALMEIGVFEAIPAHGSRGIMEIAERCEADGALIVRLMRQLTSVGIFKELKLGVWAHNRLSVLLSTHPDWTGKYFFQISIDEMLPPISRFYAYMREYGKKDIVEYKNTPHSWTDRKMGMTFWEVLNSEPERVQRFAQGLSLFDAIHPIVGIYPFEAQHAAGNSPDRTLAVDIGGGRGLAMLYLRQGCPTLQGKLVLQDRQEVIDAIRPEDLPGVEKMQHDFFRPQPVKGAQIYYIRRVFHDWLDDEARQILENIVPAMAPDSRILISDMALPEPVTAEDANAVWLDLMMLMIGGKERTGRDWERLVQSAGLRLVKMWQRKEWGPLVVVECALPNGVEGNGIEGMVEEEMEEMNGTEGKAKMETTEVNGTGKKADTETQQVNSLANVAEEVHVNGHSRNGVVEA